MDKKTYYVSVQAKTILPNQGDASYEFEIAATDEELDVLQELFELLEDDENGSYIRSHVPALPYHHDGFNDGYDDTLKQIYSLLSEWGTQETKEHIARMNFDHIES